MSYGQYRDDRSSAFKMRLIIAAVIALISFVMYLGTSSNNPITGEKQRVSLSSEDEIALGLNAEPQMIQQYGGLVRDGNARAMVDRVGGRLLKALNAKLASQGRRNPYPFKFHLLADSQTINAFALPGGQVFITAGLFRDLETEGQLAGVLGHEVGHVLARHGAQQLAKQQLTQGLVGAAGVAGGSADSARMAQAIGEMVNMKYGRQDENDADEWGVKLMADAGYDPRAMLGVMKILDRASQGNKQPEILSTHPNPPNREKHIEAVIKREFPNGVPAGLEE
jgi:predicted Zn-dependent protease